MEIKLWFEVGMEKQTVEMVKEAKQNLEDRYCVKISAGAFDLAVEGLRTFDSKLVFEDASPKKAVEILEGASKMVWERFRDCGYERGFYEKAYQLRWALVELIELHSKNLNSDLGSWVTRLRWDRDDASIFMYEYLRELGRVVELHGEKLDFFKDIEASLLDFDVVRFLSALRDGFLSFFSYLLTVKDSDIAEVASNLSDVPATQFLPSVDYQERKAIKMTSKRVLEQEHVISEIYETLSTSSPRYMSSSTHPRGSFLLFGPPGSGKIEIIKSVAQHWYCDATRLVEIDVSDRADELVLWRHLREAVARRPYSVFALEKIEKATPCVTMALVDVLSNKGSPVDLSRSILFMTSSSVGSKLELACEAGKIFGADLLDSVDKVLAVKRFGNYKSVFRLLLREVVREVTGQRLVVHVSQDGLHLLFCRALTDQFPEEGGKALKRSLLEHIIPGLPVGEDLNNVLVYVDMFPETSELSFSFHRHEQSADDWYLKLEDGIFEKWMSNLRTKVESVGRIWKLGSEYLLDSDNIGSPLFLVDNFFKEIQMWSPFQERSQNMFRHGSAPSAPSSWDRPRRLEEGVFKNIQMWFDSFEIDDDSVKAALNFRAQRNK